MAPQFSLLWNVGTYIQPKTITFIKNSLDIAGAVYFHPYYEKHEEIALNLSRKDENWKQGCQRMTELGEPWKLKNLYPLSIAILNVEKMLVLPNMD